MCFPSFFYSPGQKATTSAAAPGSLSPQSLVRTLIATKVDAGGEGRLELPLLSFTRFAKTEPIQQEALQGEFSRFAERAPFTLSAQGEQSADSAPYSVVIHPDLY